VEIGWQEIIGESRMKKTFYILNLCFILFVSMFANVFCEESSIFLSKESAAVLKDVCFEVVTTHVLVLKADTINLEIGECFQFDDDCIIDGNGAKIVFLDYENPQFIIAPGKTVTVKNVCFYGIKNNTFQFGDSSNLYNVVDSRSGSTLNNDSEVFDLKICYGSVLKISKNIVFELSEDVSFSLGTIFIEDLEDRKNIVTICGIDGKKKLEFFANHIVSKFDETDNCEIAAPYNTVNTGDNIITLQDVELVGLDAIYSKKDLNLINLRNQNELDNTVKPVKKTFNKSRTMLSGSHTIKSLGNFVGQSYQDKTKEVGAVENLQEEEPCFDRKILSGKHSITSVSDFASFGKDLNTEKHNAKTRSIKRNPKKRAILHGKHEIRSMSELANLCEKSEDEENSKELDKDFLLEK
jgi:hypothetical protein